MKRAAPGNHRGIAGWTVRLSVVVFLLVGAPSGASAQALRIVTRTADGVTQTVVVREAEAVSEGGWR